MSATPLRERLHRLGVDAGLALSPHQLSQLEAYLRLLAQWNEKINLTALALEGFPAASLDRLIGEPLRAAAYFQGRQISWLDLGSGGGSPAIPLGVALPACALTMVESRSRKAAFLREAGRTCQLGDAEVQTLRMEELATACPGRKWGAVSLRAVRLDAEVSAAVLAVTAADSAVVLFGAMDWRGLRPSFEEVRQRDGITVLRRVSA